MFASPAFTQNGSVRAVQQNYRALNRGDMFVPRGRAGNKLAMMAGAQVTPSALAGRQVHSVPVSYATPNANVRPRNIGIAITPQGSVQS